MFADVKDAFPNSDTIMRDCFMLGDTNQGGMN